MGSAIVSTALRLGRYATLSRVLLGVAAGVWIALAAVLACRVVREPDRVRDQARSPSALTAVAATAVLGGRLTELGWTWAGAATLAIALLLWLTLLAPVLQHWSTPTVGASLMLAVSTESLAVLAATLAAREHAAWLLYAACGPFVVGLAAYGAVMARFDLRQVAVGRGDQWITGGALGILALAGAQITLAALSLDQMVGLVSALKTTSTVLWVMAIAWLPILLSAEVLRPRLDYDVRRWSTVFPFGMYAACSFVVGVVVHSRPITDFAKIWVWVSVVVWLVVSAATLRRLHSGA